MKFWFLAIFNVWGLNAALSVQNNICNSALALPLIWALHLLYRKTFEKMYPKRILLLTVPFSLLFSFTFIYGASLLQDVNSLPRIGTIIETVALFPCIFCILLHLSELDLHAIDSKITIDFYYKKIGYLIFALIFLCWFIELLTMMPGYWGYDGVFQLQSYINGNISTHHPVLHTYLMCGIMTLGKQYLGSYEMGLLVYSLLQMLILDYAITKMILFIRDYSKAIAIGTLGCCCLLPYHAILSFSSTKDTLYSAIFVLWILVLIHGVIDLKNWNYKYICKLVCLSFLMCALRNNGIYVYIATIPFLLGFCRKNWKWLVITILCTSGIWIIYAGPVYSQLHISKGSIHEMLSIPCQQLCNAYLNSSNLTENERNKITEYIPAVESYVPRIADNVKNSFNDSLFLSKEQDFFKLWFQVGIKNISLYFNALANTSIGFWYADMVYPDPGAWHPYLEYILDYNDSRISDNTYVHIKQWSYFPWLTKINYDFCKHACFQQIPVISVLCNAGFYFWLLMAEVYLILCKKIYPWFIGIIPAILYWGTCILGPVVLLRYAYPYILTAMMMSAPILTSHSAQR